MWVAKSGSIATLATGFFLYLANFFPAVGHGFFRNSRAARAARRARSSSGTVRSSRIVLILLLGGLNYFGVKVGGDVQVAVTVVKVGLIACRHRGRTAASATRTRLRHRAGRAPLTIAGFFAALVARAVGLRRLEQRQHGGFGGAANPQRNLPLALIGGTLAVIAIYLLANCGLFPCADAGRSGRERPGGGRNDAHGSAARPGANAVSIAAMISIFAALNGSILTGLARALRRRARRPVLPLHRRAFIPQFRTPGVSILVLSVWSAVLVLSGKYDDLFNLVIFASWILYGMTTAAVIVLRKKKPIWRGRIGLWDIRSYRYYSLLERGVLLFSTAMTTVPGSRLWELF